MNNYTHTTTGWAQNYYVELLDSMNNTQWETEENSLADIELVVEGVAIPVITTLGLVGNILSIIVLHSPGIDMKVTFREVLTMLAIFDSLFILCASISFSLPHLSEHWKVWIHPHLFPWILPFIQISLNGSIWSTVSVTIERYVSVVHPRHWFCTFSSIIYIVPVIFLTVLWNIPRFMELKTCYRIRHVSGSIQLPEICPTFLRKNLSYTRDYILIANFLVMALIPFLLLAVLNYLLFRTIQDSGKKNRKTTTRQKRDQKIAAILIFVVLVFGCCNFVRIITNMYEVCLLALHGGAKETWPAWCELLTFLSHFLLVFNSSINIVIYCWKDEKFRNVLFRLLGLSLNSKPNIGWILAVRTAAIIGDTAMQEGGFDLLNKDSPDPSERKLTRQETTETCIMDIKPLVGRNDTLDSMLEENTEIICADACL